MDSHLKHIFLCRLFPDVTPYCLLQRDIHSGFILTFDVQGLPFGPLSKLNPDFNGTVWSLFQRCEATGKSLSHTGDHNPTDDAYWKSYNASHRRQGFFPRHKREDISIRRSVFQAQYEECLSAVLETGYPVWDKDLPVVTRTVGFRTRSAACGWEGEAVTRIRPVSRSN